MKERIKIVLFMVGIALLFGSGVTGIHLLSQGIMQKNKLFLEQKSLVELFGLGNINSLSKEQVFTLVKERVDSSEKRVDPTTNWQFTVIKAYEDAERTKLKAYGFEFEGLGFWAPIKGKLAVSPDLKQTIGIKITEQQETPGLGGRIEEKVFTNSFINGLNITKPEKGAFLYMGVPDSQPLEGSPQYGRKFDAITGATQTSMAMERMLNEFVARFVRAMKNSPQEDKNGI